MEKCYVFLQHFLQIFVIPFFLINDSSAAEDTGGQFMVTGTVTFQNESLEDWDELRPMRRVSPGEIVFYEFQLNVTEAQSVEAFSIIIKGSAMEFEPDFPDGVLKMVWYDVSGYKLNLPSVMSTKNNYRELKAVVTTYGFPIAQIDGSYAMKVKDQISGPLLTVGNQLEIHVVPIKGESPKPSVILSEPLSLPLPEMSVSSAFPVRISMKESATTSLTMLLPAYKLKESYLKLLLPFSEEKSEAKITYDKFFVKDTAGFKTIMSSNLKKIKETGISKTATSEKSEAMIVLPEKLTIPETAGNNATIVFEASCILQDFDGYSNGTILDMGFGFKVNEDAIWVARSSILVIDNLEETNTISRRPVLDMAFTQFRNYRDKDKLITKFRINLSHSDKSNGSAYNVTASVYLPPYVNIIRPLAVYDAVRPVEIDILDKVIQMQFDRISLLMNTRYLFNISLDTTDERFLKAETLGIVYEAVYNGWRHDTEFDQPLKMHQLLLDKDAIMHEIYGDDLTCPCPFDPKSTSCACCNYGGCSCGSENPYKCVECSNMWSCRDTLPGYNVTSVLKQTNKIIYTCDKKKDMRPGRPYVSCYKEEDGVNKAMSPFLGGILGLNKASGTLFGVSNTGFGYVASHNGGVSWVSVSEYTYMNAIKNGTFVNATIKGV